MEFPTPEEIRAARMFRELARESSNPELATWQRIEFTRVRVANELATLATDHDANVTHSAAIAGHDPFQRPDVHDDHTRLGITKDDI